MKKVIINIAILAIIGGFVWFVVDSVSKGDSPVKIDAKTNTEEYPFEEVMRIEIDGLVCFDLVDGEIYAATQDSVLLDNGSFAIKSGIRDIKFANGEIYLLYPTSVKVYDKSGKLNREWEACSENSDYCALEVTTDAVWVTDASNKNICKYDLEGVFNRFVDSPHGFVIPSYSFDITSYKDTIYVANSGKHHIESYTSEGRYIISFGSPSDFVGCCNPSYITINSYGDLLTSEKGEPRIQCWGLDGKKRGVLFGAGGKDALEIKTYKDMIYAGDKKGIRICKLNKKSSSGCEGCAAACPLRK